MSRLPIDKFVATATPFYYYDTELLECTLKEIVNNTEGFPIKVHYALKANINPIITKVIRKYGLGVDCVSAGEILKAKEAGFKGNDMVYAGVAKTDSEIEQALDADILCFNVESIEELDIINDVCKTTNKTACVCLRINPDIDAHTHKYITTGLAENKFGISMQMLDAAIQRVKSLPHIQFKGLHFHIGSQITIQKPFEILCERINAIVKHVEESGLHVHIINVGGGLGIDYDNPTANPVADFKSYFDVFKANLDLSGDKEMHCELGRAIVAQCGTLISRVVLVKHGIDRKFVMLDAGMNDLIRPALYQAEHHIENLSATDRNSTETYDIVGPICESADLFASDIKFPETKRGDIIAIYSAGAYGETMASTYNCRPLCKSLSSEDFNTK